MIDKLKGRIGDDLNIRLKVNEVIDDVNFIGKRLITLEKNMSDGIREKEPDKKDCICLKPCPHCGRDDDDLEVTKMLFDELDGDETIPTKEFVYCSGCGHYGDLDTWNDRVKNGGG